MSKRIKLSIVAMVLVASSFASAGTAFARGFQCYSGPGYLMCNTGGGDTCVFYDDGTHWCSTD